MGRYSYSQPSSSEEYDIDITSLLQAEADLYADEADSRDNIAEAVEYLPQPECDDGIPKTCYCGGEAVVETSYTSKDPGRRYFTCGNADDGDCHVWKWWDVAVMEELRDYQRQLREVKDQANESDEKLVKVEQTVEQLVKKKTGIANGYPLLVCVLLSVVFLLCMVIMFKWVAEKENVLTESMEELQEELQRSGQNDDDVMKAALDIFFNNYSSKFALEHAWRELRHEKKWCSAFLSKDKRKQPVEVDGEDAVAAGEARPIGVKAAKASIKRKKSGRDDELEKIQGIMEMKEKISKRKVLERLIAKTGPLSEMETSLKMKLLSEML